MCIPNDPAFAVPETERNRYVPGLTKREYFAAMAMQGLSAAETDGYAFESHEKLAKAAVRRADALLAELSK